MGTLRLTLLASLLFFVFFTIIEPNSATTGDNNQTVSDDFIRTSCATTPYSDICYAALSGYAAAVQQDQAELARVAVAVSLDNANDTANYLCNLPRRADNVADILTSGLLYECCTLFRVAAGVIGSSLSQMRSLVANGDTLVGDTSFRIQMINIQAFMNAAITNQQTCADSFSVAGVDGPTRADVSDHVAAAMKYTDVALALVNTYAGRSFP